MSSVKVNDGLQYVLYLSCIIGVSCVKITRCNREFNAEFSKPLVVYSYCLYVINNIIVVAYVIYVLYDRNASKGWFLVLIMSVSTRIIPFRNRVNRADTIIQLLTIINKIKEDYNINKYSLKFEKKYILCWLIYFASLTFYMGLLIHYFIRTCQNMYNFIYLLITYNGIHLITLEAKTVVCQFQVYGALKCVTQKTQQALRGNESISMPADQNIRDVSKMYVKICNVVGKMNEENGSITCALIIGIILSVTLIICHVVNVNNGIIFLDFTGYFLFVTLLIRLYVYVESCHYVPSEVNEVKVVMSKAMNHYIGIGKEFSWEWNLIFRQLYLVEATFVPLGMINLNRSSFSTVSSVLTTYLVIVIPQIRILKEFILN
ncbi:uncharacterized protein LOC133319992 [Danaus plexippus]|uniref:uncharacterized protein LOC133319992 n=1 Tax=Danaus plexippus TaxID=13037 RepID=UPI002AB253A2|nr:uncharacterized protein LOC133319992 [Danaus plexippus]